MDIIEQFLEKLKQAYTNFDASIIADLLSDDFTYSSFFEFHNIKTKQAYLEYLKNKLQSMKDSDYEDDLEHLYESETGKQVLVFSKKRVPPGNEFVCFIAEANENGLINKLDLTLTSFYEGFYGPKGFIDELLQLE